MSAADPAGAAAGAAATAPAIEEWTSAQTQYRPPFSDELAGRTLTLHGPAGRVLELRFEDAHTLRRSFGAATTDPNAALHYDASAVRPGILLLDYSDPEWPAEGALPWYPRRLTWALDLNSGRATLAVSAIVAVPHNGQGALLRARTEHEFWAVGPDAEPHPRTAGLVGNRVLWRYSDTDEYEHVYLTDSAFAWQCLRGVERGLTELDPSRAYEIADDLYFFHWSETELVVDTALFIDLAALRTFGRFYILDAADATLTHHQFGARGELLGTARYPDP